MIIIKLFTWFTHMVQSCGTKMFNIYYKFHKYWKNISNVCKVYFHLQKNVKIFFSNDMVEAKKFAPKKIVQCDNICIVKPCNSTWKSSTTWTWEELPSLFLIIYFVAPHWKYNDVFFFFQNLKIIKLWIPPFCELVIFLHSPPIENISKESCIHWKYIFNNIN